MPTIAIFYGIKITMNYNEHNPPHFHAEYQGYEIIADIYTGIVTGKMPKRAINLIKSWLDRHRNELSENWERAKKRQQLKQIEPLE
jgi:uncharacterized protein YabN with tetrapyrrole methylase and pyrophosphatase domain